MNQMESVIKCVRGLLITSKYPIDLKQLDSDYRTIVGEKIPFSKFGFKNLAEFLNSDSSVEVFNNNGEIFARATTLKASAHIVKMKMKEKSKKPKKNAKYATRPAVPKNWRPQRINKYATNKYVTSSRPPAYLAHHNQFLDYRVHPLHPVPVSRRPVISTVAHRFQKYKIKPEERESSNYCRKVLSEFTKHLSQQNIEEQHYLTISNPMQTITKMISNKNISENSSLNDISSLTPNSEFKENSDPKINLKNLIEYHKLGPIDVCTRQFNGKRFKTFICKVKIGNHVFTSYPEEFHSESEAELYCYQEAFKELSNKYGIRKPLLLASDKDILERIPKILEPHSRGLWEWQVRMDYSEKYHEQLPEDWLKTIDSSPCIHVQKVINTYTLKYCKPEDICISSNTIKFGENGRLYAEVQCVMSAGEIWCQQIDTDEYSDFVNMTVQMEEFYNMYKNNFRASVVNKNGCYAAQYDDAWYRIRALEVTDTEVSSFFIDTGDEHRLPRTNIYKLIKKFAICPAQAFICRLAGLEEFYEVEIESTILQQTLTYKQVILELAPDIVNEVENDISISVYIYDFSTGRCINEELIPLMAIESASPDILPEEITEVYVSHIAANGDVYVQIRSAGYYRLLQSIEELETQIFENPPTDLLTPITKKNSTDKIYLGKYDIDGHWYRIKIIDWSPDEELAQVFYLDFGNTAIISVKNAVLYPLDKLNDVLASYPSQAVKTTMLLDEVPQNFMLVTKKLIPEEQPIIIKAITYRKGTPIVEFFRRNEDGTLLCINKAITMEKELEKLDSSKNTRKSAQSPEVPKLFTSVGKLKLLKIAVAKETFEVYIPFAVHPHNFFIQPLETLNKLNTMMEKLQEQYQTVQYSPLTVDSISPGNVYASKFEDGKWYRTVVVKVVKNGSISVFYCDYGYYANLTVQQLVPLDIEFMELPCQVLKAKLSGIKPKHTKWIKQHCEEFKGMVEQKCFYSVILEAEKDELCDNDIVLNLLLINTSSDEDIYIGKELVKKEIAVKV